MAEKATQTDPVAVELTADLSSLDENTRDMIKTNLIAAIKAETDAKGIQPAFSRVRFDKWEN